MTIESGSTSYDPRYVEARRVLLDALIALAPHASAVIVAGAQAIYLQTGDAGVAIAPYTTDGDLALDPTILGDDPNLEAAMASAGLTRLTSPRGHSEPGTWVANARLGGEDVVIPVDLIVPQALGKPGKRGGARLGSHGKQAARLVPGIEAVLVDHQPMTIKALDPADTRSLDVKVAGVAAMLVAKAHKIHDREVGGKSHRQDDKDASDVVRLMQTTSPTDVAVTLADLMTHAMAGESTADGVRYLDELFGRRSGRGIVMATRALEFGIPAAAVETLSVSYTGRLLEALREQSIPT